MNNLVKAFRGLQLATDASVLLKHEFHTSTVLMKKIKRSPNSAHELPEPIKTSWGKLVARGMRPKEPVTEYTIDPIPIQKTGGRGVTGRIEIRRIGGGLPVVWHMADLHRITETEEDPKVEVVRRIIPEQTRSGHLALVAGGSSKRWIIATDGMRVGDIIKSTRELTNMPIQGSPGDSHPVGSLPIGTVVCCVERVPFGGSKVANAAGASATITKKVGRKVSIKMPSKREMIVDEKCLCVVGKVSNTERNKVDFGKAGVSRWLGIRPKRGLRMKKTGLHGRKVKPTPKPKEYKEEKKLEIPVSTFTVDADFIDRGKPLWYSAM